MQLSRIDIIGQNGNNGDHYQMSNEIRDLQQELITRVGELQVMSEQNAELKVMVEELRERLQTWQLHFGNLAEGANEPEFHIYMYVENLLYSLLDKTPAQSLHDHDMAVAERVREACIGLCRNEVESRGFDYNSHVYDYSDRVEMLAGNYNKIGDAIRNLDLSGVLKEVE